MDLPPGPRYLVHSIPTFAVPSLAAYLLLTLLQRFYSLPLWLTAPAVVLARPILSFGGFYYRKWMTRRTAASLGAVTPPIVREWALNLIRRMAKATRNGYPGDAMNQLNLTYGDIYQMDIFTQAVVVTTEPEHVKAILATQFDSFEKGPLFFDQMHSLLGSGVFNADGEIWKFHRAMTRPFFTRERISDFEIYHRNCDLSLQTAKKRLNEGLSLDFQDLVSRFTFDSAAEFLFGHNVGSLSAGIPYPPSHKALTPRSFYEHPSTTVVEAFREGEVQSMCRLSYGVDWPLWEFWKDKVKPKRKIADDFIGPLAERALENREKELEGVVESKAEDKNLLAHLVKHTQDLTILKDELVNLLVAGRDTTAALLTFAMYTLTQHPDIEKRLREEIFNKVGPASSPTYEHMREMKYTRAFLNEVLRLYPPVCTNKDVLLPPARPGQKSILIPANTPTVYNIISMQQRTDLWGPDALEFDPDRFLDERLHRYLIPNPYIFTPFNAGPRICLGQQFAYHEATFFIVRLLQHFTEFTLDNAVNAAPPAEWAFGSGRKAREKIHPLTHLTMYVKDGLWVRMKELPGA